MAESKRDQAARKLIEEIPEIPASEVNPNDGGNWGKGFRTKIEAGRYLTYAKQQAFIRNTKDYLHLVRLPNGTYRFRVIPKQTTRRSRARRPMDFRNAIDE